MGLPAGDGRSPAPIDRPLLKFLQSRLSASDFVDRARISDDTGHLELRVAFAPSYYPATVDTAVLTVRWYTNDDFMIHYRDEQVTSAWECRWDRHPNPHNTRDHFHPPPTAVTPGEDRSWPTDHRDVVTLVLDAVEERIQSLWND